MIAGPRQRLLSVACGVIFLTLLGGTTPSLAADLRIEVAEEGWGSATRADVNAVLVSAAKPLWKAAGSPQLPLIRIDPSGGPIVLHRRDPDGAIRVRLAVQGRRWAQMAYQFGHEMSHILCGFDEDPDPHHWLEEAACEAASLFTLRKMAKNWKRDPPYANWISYSEHLEAYAQKLIDKGALPEGATVESYYRQHRVAVESSPVKRDKLLVIAVGWLHLMEQDPGVWRALRYLNQGVPESDELIGDALRRWKTNCPGELREQVDRVAEMLGVAIDDDSGEVEDVED